MDTKTEKQFFLKNFIEEKRRLIYPLPQKENKGGQRVDRFFFSAISIEAKTSISILCIDQLCGKAPFLWSIKLVFLKPQCLS